MRARGVGAGGGAFRGGRWGRSLTGRPTAGSRWTVFLPLLPVLFIVGLVAGFAWRLEQELERGLLRQRAEQQRRPDWTPLAALPPYLPRAILLVEDPGYLRRTELQDLGNPGGKTVPRRLLRQVYGLDAGVWAEARAMTLAPLLERRLTRTHILEFYLNRARFGRSGRFTVVGIGDAAREYFDKAPAELTLGESATLAGLLLPPPLDDPRLRSGAVGARRNEVLRRLLAAGVIDDAGFRGAVAEPLAFQPGLRYAPMSRPARWQRAPAPVVIPPPPLNPAADSAT